MANPTPNPNFAGLQIIFARLPADRLDKLDSHAKTWDELGLPFSQPVDAFDCSRGKTLIVLILDDRARIIRAGVGHRGYSGGTALSQLAIADLIHSAQINTDPIVNALPTRFRTRTRTAIEHSGLLSPGASTAFLKQLSLRHPEIVPVLNAANAKKHNPIDDLSEKQQLRVQEERDAGFTAMFIAGMDRKDFIVSSPIESMDGNQWFLDQVLDTHLRENLMLANDFKVFPGFSFSKDHVGGAMRMRRQNIILTILLVHEQPLETLTGSDLIYYNETFGSFVMVQYKAMEPESDGHVFRLPNKGLAQEITNMLQFQKELESVAPEIPSSSAFRFHYSPFFLKFCPRSIQQPTDPELVNGMYFPLGHWQLIESKQLQGPKGGQGLRYRESAPKTNADRYMTNSDFATLVRDGWIGTAVNQSTILQEVIKKTLASGRSVTFASVRDATIQNA